MNNLPRTYDQVKVAAENSSSIRQMLLLLGYAISGPNSRTVDKMLKTYNISIPDRQPGRRGVQIKLSNLLVDDGPFIDSKGLRKRLVKEGIMIYKCVLCENDGTWMGQPITLQLDHINGNHKDNRLENLRILCPNCHCQTETWGCKKRS